MLEIGKKDDLVGADELVKINLINRPEELPTVPEGHSVLCGYDQGLGDKMYVCDNLEDMQTLYDAYARGGAMFISWYSAEYSGSIQFVAMQ